MSQTEERAKNFIQSRIYDTRIDNAVPSLRWRAAGELGLFDGPVTYCHWYTAIAWTDELKEFFIGQQQQVQGDNWSHHSPLLSLPSYTFAHELTQFDDPVVLPQGFSVSKRGGLLSDYFLQFAYSMGRPERMRYQTIRHLDALYEPPIGPMFSPNPKSTAASGDFLDVYDRAFVTWESRSIYKDEENDDESTLREHTIVLAGDHIGMIMPHYGITPRNESDANLLGGHLSKYRTKNGRASYKVAAMNVPFQFAVPVLTGWNLNLVEDDEQIREIGIWIDDVKWFPRGRSSDLEYTVNAVFVDDEKSWFDLDVGVSYLGFNNLRYDP